jgi:hypothetical protein
LALGVRIVNRGGGGSRFRRIRRLQDNRLFHGRFGFRFRFRRGRWFRSGPRLHRRLFLGRRLFLLGNFFGRRFFRREFGLRLRLRLGRKRFRRRARTPAVYQLEDYRGPASGGKAQSLRRTLGKIHNAAFGGGYTARNGCDNLFIVPGICNLYLSPQGQTGMARGILVGLNILGSGAFLMEIPKLRLSGAKGDKNSGKR